jgi:hypothetical protein
VRHLVEPFAVGALRRGQSIEQFLGPAGTPQIPAIRWVSIEPSKLGYVVTLHVVRDVGGEGFYDLIEFPPLDPDDEFGQELVIADDPLTAMTTAEVQVGAVRDRWVNVGLAGDEYRDYVRAGRPPV